jgi:O-antigen/teichoic acid export membrane protein
MNLKSRLYSSTAAAFFYQASSNIARFIQIPMFIKVLGVVEYGDWILFVSVPASLTFLTLGLGATASNLISGEFYLGDIRNSSKYFSSAVLLNTIIIFSICIIYILSAQFLNYFNLSNNYTRSEATILVMVLLIVYTFIPTYYDIIMGLFRIKQISHFYFWILGIRPWFELLLIFILFSKSKSFLHISLVLVLSAIMILLLFYIVAIRNSIKIKLSLKLVSSCYLIKLLKDGSSFQLISIGNTILNQGYLFTVSSIMGQFSLVIFTTLRTLVGLISQLMSMLNQILWPEFTFLISKKNYSSASRLNHIGTLLSLIIAITGCFILFSFGHTLFRFWTGNDLEIDNYTLFVFLLPFPFLAIYSTSTVILAATNSNRTYSLLFLLGSIFSVFLSIPLGRNWGILGIAYSSSIYILFVIRHALIMALRLTNDTLSKFFKGVLKEFIILIKCYLIPNRLSRFIFVKSFK